jgi:hypothetical protein
MDRNVVTNDIRKLFSNYELFTIHEITIIGRIPIVIIK